VLGNNEAVKEAKQEMLDQFDCDEIRNMNEYVGCKLSKNNNKLKLTQPVLLQSFKDEFDLGNKMPAMTPAEPGQILLSCDEADCLNKEDQKIYRLGVGKLLHMMGW